MENNELFTRLYGLEQEIELLKADFQPPAEQNAFVRRCRDGLRFLVSNWVLVTVLLGLATAIIGIFVYDVNPFENFESIKTRRDLSEFYREQGDRLLERQYYEAAADAFQMSVEIDPNNILATYGMAKAQVFIPDDGQMYVSSGIVDSKLDYLLEAFPNDYHLYLLRGHQYESQGDTIKAKEAYENAIRINENFVYGYIALGVQNQYRLDSDEIVQKTIGYYEKALGLDPDNADASSNLGYMYMLLGDFDKALNHLNEAYFLSWSLVTILDLGEVYTYMGDFQGALALHQSALVTLNKPGMENDESFMGKYGWFYNYMPQKPGDSVPAFYPVQVTSVPEKKIFLHYALSFDYALTGDFERADSEFNKAYQLDETRQYRDFFANKISSLENFLSDYLDRETRFWLEARGTQLRSL